MKMEVTVSLPVTERVRKPESEGCHEFEIDDIVTSRAGATAYRVKRASYQLGFEVFGAAIGLAGVIYRLWAPRF